MGTASWRICKKAANLYNRLLTGSNIWNMAAIDNINITAKSIPFGNIYDLVQPYEWYFLLIIDLQVYIYWIITFEYCIGGLYHKLGNLAGEDSWKFFETF